MHVICGSEPMAREGCATLAQLDSSREYFRRGNPEMIATPYRSRFFSLGGCAHAGIGRYRA